MAMDIPALPMLLSLIIDTILVRGLWPVLLRASPGKNGDGQAPPAPAQFLAARLGPQYWDISARQQG